MVTTLKIKLLSYLKRRAEKGASHSQLLQRFQRNCRTAELTTVLEPLVASAQVIKWIDTQRAGRPCRMYYHRDHVPVLTSPVDVEPPTDNNEGPVSTRTSLCQVCGVAIPLPKKGHPYAYCSKRCKSEARAGTTLRQFLLPATDPRIFAEVATCLVMADLIMRGFRVGREMFRGGGSVLVADDLGVCQLTVVTISFSGTFPDLQQFEAAAAVYRDGRIYYGGKNPIVVMAKEALDPESASEAVNDEAISDTTDERTIAEIANELADAAVTEYQTTMDLAEEDRKSRSE